MDLQLEYPGNEGNLVQFPSSEIDQTGSESPPPSPNAFSQLEDESDNHARFSDWGPSDFDLDGNTEPIPADLDPPSLERDLGDEGSVPAASTEFHPLINGMYIKYVILQLLNE
jgi:hypothetical protein